jgi:serine/threonine protein kinase/type II secretory pathway pseudopilin PulG
MTSNLEGTLIDKYRLGRLLGKGGMGTVYLAQHEALNRPVAVKIIHPHLMNDPQFQSRFLQEAQTAANLDHPSIIRIHDFNKADDRLYMVMEFIAKGSLVAYLEEWRKQGSGLPLAEALHLVAQVAEALGYAHQRGIIHRDVKPDNVLLKVLDQPERTGEPALRAVMTDFGLAKLKEGSLLQTEASMLLGTLPYISPEQLKGKRPDGRSDLYSLGILLYELLTGRPPFAIRNADEAFQQHCQTPPPSPRLLRPDVPPAVEKIITTAMSKEPDARYRSGVEMVAVLRQALHALPTQATQMAALPKEMPPPAAKPSDQLTISCEGEPDRTYPLLKSTLTIGRTDDNDIVLPKNSVSGRHARLQKSGNGWQVTDLQSTNGTLLGNTELTPHVPQPWLPGDKLTIGPYTLIRQTAVAPIYQPPPPPPVRPVVVMAPPPPKPLESADSSQPELTHLGSIRLEPFTVSLKPGAQTVVQAHMHNESARVDEFTVAVEGLPRDWVRFSESSVRLMPNKETTFRFTIQPPLQETRAKTYPYRLILRSQVDKRVEGHAFGNLLVEPAPRFTASLSPVRVQNKGIAQLTIQNTGNTDERFMVLAQEANEAVLFDQMAQRVTVLAGQEERLNFQVKPVHRPLTGSSKKSHPFQLQVFPTAGEPKTQAGQLEVSAWLPRWILALLLILTVGSAAIPTYSAARFRQDARGRVIATATAMKATALANDDATATAEAILGATQANEATATATALAAQNTATAIAAIATNDASDTDGDNRTNAEEADDGTDPNNPDTDGDRLCDGEEWLLKTNPGHPHSDDDGIDDGSEVEFCLNKVLQWTASEGNENYCFYDVDFDDSTDPRCSHPGDTDSDGDGIDDNEDDFPLQTSTPSPTPTATPEAPPTP